MKTAVLILLTFILMTCAPLWAGTEITAHLESLTYRQIWIDLDIRVDQGKVRLNFRGPWANGALLYDKQTSVITLVDGIDRKAIPVNDTDQKALKFMEIVSAGELKSKIAETASMQMAYNLIASNACALFNGTSVLTDQHVHMGIFICDDYGEDIHGATGRETWVTYPKLSVLSQDDYDTLRGLMNKILDLFGPILQGFGAQVEPFLEGNVTSQWPAQVVLYADGKATSRLKTNAIRAVKFGPDTFNPPADYETLGLLGLVRQRIKGN